MLTLTKKKERIAVLKDENTLDQLDDEDTVSKRALLTDTSIDQDRFNLCAS